MKRSAAAGGARRTLRVVLSGGGTGGHVYPALALHSLLRDAGLVAEALYLGTPGGAEEQIISRLKGTLDIPFRPVVSAPWAGASRLQQLRALPRIALGTVQAASVLLRFRPDLVLAAGGWAAAPTVFAAYLLKPFLQARIVIEEQNLVPGLLNKAASLLADLVFVSFEETVFFLWGRRCVQAGYPVRKVYLDPVSDPLEIRRRLDLPEGVRLVLVTGGSMGARNINQALAKALPDLTEDRSVLVVHAIGLRDDDEYPAFADTCRLLESLPGLEVASDEERITARRSDGALVYLGYRFLNNMSDYQRVADLVVTRGGAGTLAELAALGRAALVIPKRGLPGDHQELNAVAIAKKGGCEVLFERREPATGQDFVDATELCRIIRSLLSDEERRRSLGCAAASLFDRSCHRTFLETICRLFDGKPDAFLIEPFEPPELVRFQAEFDQVVQALGRLGAEPGWRNDAYYRLYDTKVDELRLSSDFAAANMGAKLIGALRRDDLYPFLAERFPSSPPFLKRNILTALRNSDAFHDCFRDVIRNGLQDGYWEARREAIALYRKFHADLAQEPEIRHRIRRLMQRPQERWDTRAEAIRAAPTFLQGDELLRALRPFLGSRRVRLREAVLEAIEWGLKNGQLTPRDGVQAALRRMLVTTSEYRADFAIRRKLQGVLDVLKTV